jgi:hypothetical protein
MPMQQKFDVKGTVNFPLVFPITCESYETAIDYAKDVLNNASVLKVEMHVHTSDAKIHLIICDEYNWKWIKQTD